MDINEKAEEIARILKAPPEYVKAIAIENTILFPLGTGDGEAVDNVMEALKGFNASAQLSPSAATGYVVCVDAKTIAEGSLHILEESGIAENIADLIRGKHTGRLVADRSKFPQATVISK